jgi:hypothetical protein
MNLFVPPPNWLQTRLPDGTIVGKSVYHGLPDSVPPAAKEQWSVALAYHIPNNEDVDVIAPAEQVKELFKLPYSTGPLSLSVHRLGSTLILDKGPCANTPTSPFADVLKGTQPALDTASAASRELFSKFLYRSALPPPPVSDVAAVSEEERMNLAYLELKKKRRERSSAADEPLPSGPSLYVDAHGVAHTQPPAGDPSPAPSRVASHHVLPTESNTTPFRRVCHWRFNGYRMLLGSDLLAFRTMGGQPIALRLQDIEQKLTLGEALEMYLDNTVIVLRAIVPLRF